MTEQEAKDLAEPIIKEIVNCMADRRYDLIPDSIGFQAEGITIEDFKEWAEDYLTDNELSHYDRYGVPIDFQPQYDKSLYHQFWVDFDKSGASFEACYDLSTDGKLNDLTLITEFVLHEDGIKVYIVDLHVM